MEKTLDLKMPIVEELGREKLKNVGGGFAGLLIWALGSLAASLIQSNAKPEGAISEEEYIFWYEGVTGVPYEGWEAGY